MTDAERRILAIVEARWRRARMLEALCASTGFHDNVEVDFLALATREGIAGGEAEALLAEFEAEGLVRRVRPPNGVQITARGIAEAPEPRASAISSRSGGEG